MMVAGVFVILSVYGDPLAVLEPTVCESGAGTRRGDELNLLRDVATGGRMSVIETVTSLLLS